MNSSNDYKKICLNCNGDWDICKGVDCQCFDGACCCEFDPKDVKPFWHRLVKKK